MSLHISVITAVLNRASTLGAALRSVHGQRWAELEHIIIDGGSTDGSMDVVDEHRARIAKVISERDGGLYDALNKGIRHATGQVIGFMHADDEYASSDALAHIAAAFEDPAVEAVYGDVVYVSKNDSSRVVRYWRAGQYRRSLLNQGWMPPHPTLYVRRDVYERFGAFDTRYRIAADYEYMLRILWWGRVHAAYIPEVLVRMRTGGVSNLSLFNMLHKSREDYAAMRENGIGGLQALLLKNVTKLPQFVARQAVAAAPAAAPA
jgi:glycosyltransferase involved in cell wall biosynthesis